MVARTYKRRVAPSVKAALLAAKQDKLEQRARLINAGVEITRKRRGKYNQVRTTYKGERFDSLGEAEHAHQLDILKQNGDIFDWCRPRAIVLLDGPKFRDRITYKPDFEIWDKSGHYYVDYKGSHITETAVWRLKVKLWAHSQTTELRVAYPSGEERIVVPAK